jgi:cytochrome b
MTLALLISLPATVGTGVVEYGDKGKGPLADDGMIVVTQAHAEGDEGESGTSTGQREGGNESILSELHSTLANVTLFLIVLHILGVGLASIVHRENLVAAMIDGKKRAD